MTDQLNDPDVLTIKASRTTLKIIENALVHEAEHKNANTVMTLSLVREWLAKGASSEDEDTNDTLNEWPDSDTRRCIKDGEHDPSMRHPLEECPTYSDEEEYANPEFRQHAALFDTLLPSPLLGDVSVGEQGGQLALVEVAEDTKIQIAFADYTDEHWSVCLYYDRAGTDGEMWVDVTDAIGHVEVGGSGYFPERQREVGRRVLHFLLTKEYQRAVAGLVEMAANHDVDVTPKPVESRRRLTPEECVVLGLNEGFSGTTLRNFPMFQHTSLHTVTRDDYQAEVYAVSDGYVLAWTDYVANEWAEYYPTLGIALMRMGALENAGDTNRFFTLNPDEFTARAITFLEGTAS